MTEDLIEDAEGAVPDADEGKDPEEQPPAEPGPRVPAEGERPEPENNVQEGA